MDSEQLAQRADGVSRRTVLGYLAAAGAVGALAGCGGASSSAPGTDGGTVATPAPATTSGASGETPPFDCGAIPSSLSPFAADDAGFTFDFDGPSADAYTVLTGENAVERVAKFYFARSGTPSTNNWDFYVELSASVDTYGDVSNVSPNATEVFSFDYGDASVPVRYQAITDDHDIWVLGLPEDGAYRFVRVNAVVMPDQFGCHDTVRDIGRGVVQSIRPR